MKRICIFLLMFSISQLTLTAQSGFGVVGGTGIAATSDGFLESVGFSNSIGIHLGLFYNLEISEKFSVRPKLLYSQQGDRSDDSSGPISILGESVYKMDYITIPLEAKFFSKPYIIVGPQVGFLVNSSLQNQVLKELESSFDYGIKLGIGYDINNLFIELSAYQGAEPTLEIEIVENLIRKITNTTLQLSVGYQFN